MATAVPPPRSKMMPQLPTPCHILLPASFAPPSSRPVRADPVERRDAQNSLSSPASSDSSGRSGRADSVERWDDNKKPSRPASSSGSSRSTGRASSCERYDSKKKIIPPGTSSSSERSRGSGNSPGRASSCERWDSNKRPPSRASSADRWDIHKKPCSHATDGLDYGLTGKKQQQQQISKLQTEVRTKTSTDAPTEAAKLLPVFSGASFFDSPEPSALPLPSFLLAR